MTDSGAFIYTTFQRIILPAPEKKVRKTAGNRVQRQVIAMQKEKKAFNPYLITSLAIMAAIIYVVTLFRFPFLGSKVHFANSMCLVAGLLFGPVYGGVAAGLGSALYDAFAGGYDFINVLITFVSKFAMAYVCGLIVKKADKASVARVVVACIAGALTYVALYMLKTFIYQAFVYGYPMDAVWATVVSKLIPSLINALVAVISAPIFYHAVLPAMKHTGILSKVAA